MFQFYKSKFMKVEKVKKREEVLSDFFAVEAHRWISANKYIKASMEDFFQLFETQMLSDIVYKYKIKFVLASGQLACSLSEKGNVVIIFPQVHRLLASTVASTAHAVLAHEVGHIFLKHHEQKIGMLEAQIEADKFAMELGLVSELENILLDMPDSEEKKVRLTYLSSEYFHKRLNAS